MKNALIVIGTLALFLFMVTDAYLVTAGLLAFAVVAGTMEWSKRFR